MNISIIYRFGTPTNNDIAQYGTVCKVSNRSSDGIDMYLQISHNEDEPVWNFVGTFAQSIPDSALICEAQKILLPDRY